MNDGAGGEHSHDEKPGGEPAPVRRWLQPAGPPPYATAIGRVAQQLAGGGRRFVRVQGLKGGARPFFISRYLSEQPRPALIVLSEAKQAEALAEDLRFFFGESGERPPFERRIHHLPAWEVPPFEDLSPPAETIAARIEGLYHLQQTRNPVVITSADAVLQRVPPRAVFGQRLSYLVEGDAVDLDQLAQRLADWGYRRVGLVEDRGDFSVRGGILDIYPPAHPNPLRVELSGDTIETIREFDAVSQRSQAARPELLILPVREFDAHSRQSQEALRAISQRLQDLEVDRRERDQLLDSLASGLLFPGVEFFLPYFYPALDLLTAYLPADTLVWVDQAGAVDAAFEQARSQVERRAAERAAANRFLPPPEQLFATPSEWRAAISGWPIIELESFDLLTGADDATHVEVHSYTTANLKAERIRHRREVSFAPVADTIRAWRAEGVRVFLVATSDSQAARITRLFAAHDLPVARSAQPFSEALGANGTPGLSLLTGSLSDGFRLPDERLAVITEVDLFGEARRRRRTRPVDIGELIRNLNELKPDDFVVHIDYGVGRYRGLKHLTVADVDGDFLHLEYAGGDRLYLPADRINLVQKYVGADGAAPALDKLGGESWERVKKKARESVLAMAKELLDIYAARAVLEGHAYPSPDDYFREFEAAFPFEETPDQQRAIDDVIADLQQHKPMDRLICGDVGYGKTEVAMRAAFVSVMDGQQVAVLVPTTVLAQQHYNTFRRRFEGYPVRVAMLSRFLTRTEVQAAVKGVANGEIDVVIGTHRLLQKDLVFKQLGLLVVDEEHRFGVAHKERIKQLRKTVPVLTLTATPIPRTLQMSLMGIRDLSVIETPPVDRLAIRTYVTRFDEGIIREAVWRELQRGGQVFFVHNRVETIEMMARRLREIIPEATFAVAHGQMHERELEQVMADFFAQKTHVLVCSAIIESGLDVPNANTIIINRADHLGLAQLYQLRGRVGRSYERAYAYLMIPGEQLITKEAQKRLRVLQELDDLGGGFRLAAHDLEIRGAGNLLGKQQSGQVAAVGFELYEQMLAEAVHELRGERVQHEVEPEIQLGVPAYIPGTYIPDENQRLVIYRRLAGIRRPQDLEEIATEMLDRFGPIPPLVDTLLKVMALRRHLKDHMVVRVVLRNGWVTLQFHPEAPVEVEHLVALVQRSKGQMRLSQDFQLSFAAAATDWDGLIAHSAAVLQTLRPS
ncbi:MAG: transcription-repair coupling factor [Deltaproteobacteria bacterium]|nr:transcription-repair coupling factor [Deltaproteobacteria bacterium]